jgi:hypothetical protein
MRSTQGQAVLPKNEDPDRPSDGWFHGIPAPRGSIHSEHSSRLASRRWWTDRCKKLPEEASSSVVKPMVAGKEGPPGQSLTAVG